MPTELNSQLTKIRGDLRRRRRLENHLQQTRELLRSADQDLQQLGKQLDKEHSDVRKLEGFSLTGLLASILGNKIERLDEEKKELATAKLKYDERMDATAELVEDADRLESELQTLGDLDARHKELLAQKELFLLDRPGAVAQELTELAEQIAEARSDDSEVDDAVEAANAALTALKEVRSALSSAGSWGVVDMVGGGLITNLAKHSRINDAKTAAGRAQRCLRRLQRELGDLSMGSAVNVEIGGLATFADFFFDGLLMDWMVQSKIHRSKDNVDAVVNKVRQILSGLHQRRRQTREHAKQLQERRRELIASS